MKSVGDTPKKLRDDAIVEVVCQAHFVSGSEVPEVILGRLSDFGSKGEYNLTRLPLADVPAAIRRSNVQMSNQPLFELTGTSGRVMRIGDNVLSWHATGVNRYPGWQAFRLELVNVVDHLFAKVANVRISGLSLRYINAIVPTRHRLATIHNLDIEVTVGGERFLGPMNLNFTERHGAHHLVTTRVADTSFVNGNLPHETKALVDVEVSSQAFGGTGDKTKVSDWLELAHDLEKRAFFRLLPADVVDLLREE